ncbi:MAG: hypothetical protein MUC87_15790 [Bacteroidia bacterium]|nr:hypothetical protein [Bacteroidia bacterium]
MELKEDHPFKEAFQKLSVFGKTDVKQYYRHTEPELSNTAMNWRIHNFIQSGELKSVGRGRYTFKAGNYFSPVVSSGLRRLYKQLASQFPFASICVWDTRALTEFMQHVPGRHFVLIEAEKDVAEAVFFFLKEKRKNVFLKPDLKVLEYYTPSHSDSIIVLPLVSQSPLEQYKNVNTASLEKMLVDVFSNETLFAAYQGNEMLTIFKNAFSKYLIRESTLLRYAGRKGKREEIIEYLKKITDFGTGSGT